MLRVSGVRSDERHPDAVYQQMEITYGRFERMVMLPPEVDATKARADYSSGFLEIVLPIRPRSASKKIPIIAQRRGRRRAAGMTASESPLRPARLRHAASTTPEALAAAGTTS